MDDAADNALILGTAMHTGIQQDVRTAIHDYFMSYPIITDAHITEAMKLEYWIPKVKATLPPGEAEVKINDPDFVGFIDWLVPANEEGTLFDLFDFKYASKASRYLESDQLHLYKYFFEKTNPGKHIRHMTYIIIPKVSIKPGRNEDVQAFRRRIESELSKKKITNLCVEYEPEKVIRFLTSVKKVLEAKDYPKEESFFCSYCEYRDYCQKGIDYMILPENKRRSIAQTTKRTIWIYGAPFSGKTYFANMFPDPLMLNTDGNVKFVDAPFIPIKDEVTMSGRIANRTFGWEKFKETISELEKKQNDFKSIIVDLLEDTYEQCRLYMYDKLGITHESDDSFRAWDKVRTEFLSTIRKLTNLDYENIILISHEDTSKDITKKGGDKLTAIKPNITDKVANKVAGMVDLVARVVADGDERTLTFKADEIVFGGGRLTVKEREIPLNFPAFCDVYAEANKNAAAALSAVKPVEAVQNAPVSSYNALSAVSPDTPEQSTATEEKPTENANFATDETIPEPLPNPPVEEPKSRTRRKRGE